MGDGLAVSILRQASEQYRMDPSGTLICFSQVAQYCRKLADMALSSSTPS
jgi:hypothetical protein